MSESNKKASLAVHFRRYATGNVLVLVAGFVSFPITARLLSAEDFGVLGYWEAWILLLAAIFKLGAGDTMMRFYPHDEGEEKQREHSTNFVLVPALFGFAGWALTMIFVVAGAWAGFIDRPVVAVAAVAVVLIQVLASHVLWAMRTRELSGLGTLFDVSWRWLGVGATAVTLLYVSRSVEGLFIARVGIGVLIVALLLRWMLRNLRFSRQDLDMKRAREGFSYGIPLAFRELSHVVLGFIDRILIKWLLNDHGVLGLYIIGMSLASYVDQLVSSALNQAWTPASNRIYNTQGAEGVRAAKQRLLRPLVYICMGLAVAIPLGGQDFVRLVAGSSKLGAAPIFIVAAVMLMITPVLVIAGTGLLLERRSKTLFALTLVAAVFNVTVNLVVVPRFGVMGAALSTTGSQILLHVLSYWFCSPALRCLPEASVLLRAAVAAAACVALYLLVNLLGLEHPLLRLAVLLPVLVIGYILPVLAMDRQMRQLALRQTSLGL